MTWNTKTILAIAGTLLVLVLCLTPKALMGHENNTHGIPHVDKAVHFGMFFVFAFCWISAVASRDFAVGRSLIVLSAVVFLAFGTEWAQGLPFVNRDPDLLDSAADIAGGTAGLVFNEVWQRFRLQKGKRVVEA